MNRTQTILSAGLLLGATTLVLHSQGGGPLQPPGPPADGVYRTALEIEPRTPISEAGFVITEPGSYYLTTNITGVTGQNGIEIQAGGVKLDLMGFTLSGEGVTGTLNGIKVVGGQNVVVIRNGTIAHWGEAGIDGSSGYLANIDSIEAINNGKEGIAAGKLARVSACHVGANGTAATADGIVAINQSIVRQCIVNNNTGNGINIGDYSIADANITNSNGSHGLVAVNGCRIQKCIAVDNGRVAGGSNIGFRITYSSATGCKSDGDERGFLASSSTLTDCMAYDCARGFDLGASVTRGCFSVECQIGYWVRSSSCQVADCVATLCDTGIRIENGSGAQLTGNQINNDPGSATIGIEALTGGNIISGNKVRAATGFDIIAGNQVGPIVTDMATATSPFANFDF